MIMMRPVMRTAVFSAALATLLQGFAAQQALADAIDGEWCRDNRHFMIQGPNITTYAGTRMTGDYDRHGFRYVAPASEPEAGTEIIMRLRGDDLLDLYRRAAGATQPNSPEPEAWRRCRVTS